MGDSTEISGRALRRVQKELEMFHSDADAAGLEIAAQSADVWHVSFTCAAGTVYEGERYTLRVRFTNDYPMDSPEVVFLASAEQPPPMHPHVYTNGHICLNILGADWSPALTAKSICLSILSMLSSNPKKQLPEDNERYTRFPRKSPKTTNFVYHDDTV